MKPKNAKKELEKLINAGIVSRLTSNITGPACLKP